MTTSENPTYNKKSPTIKRILREAAELANSPSADYHAAPLEKNLFEWHFTLRGPPETPYAHGIYHGRISLPPAYPMRPPSFRFLSPSGRFEVNREICLSISEHHEDTWQPAWGVRTAVVALRGFMESPPGGQVGAIECSEEQRRIIAESSRRWRCETCAGKSCGEILKECELAAAAAAGEAGARVEEETPKDLKIGFKVKKEEVTEEKGMAAGASVGEQQSSEAAAAAAHPQQTSPSPIVPPPPQQVPPPTPAVAAGYAPLGHERNGVPAHMQGPLPPYMDPRFAPQQQQQQQQAEAEETFWLDRLIFALVAVLVGIVIKRFVGVPINVY